MNGKRAVWFRRRAGHVSLAFRRIIGRFRIAPQRVLLTVLGVAIAVGLMVTVTGVSLGLASQSVVQSDGVDFWLVPEESTVSSIAISTDSLQLGDVHDVSARIEADDRVTYSTPVLLELLPVRDEATGDRKYVLAVGIVAPPDGRPFNGVSTVALTPGDPHYANGQYDGPWTGQVVANDGTARLANLSTGSTMAVDSGESNRSFTVANVSQGGFSNAAGTVPVVVVHLSELQELTGETAGDQADQILVSTTDPAVESSLEGVYPQTTVVKRDGLSAQEVSTSNLPLAVALSAFVSAVVVGVLFVTTLMGLEVSADRRQLATLAAIGYSNRARSTLVAVETVVVTVIGGVVGLGVGVLGIIGANHLGTVTFGVGTVAVLDPRLAVYALAVTVIIGILGAAYPVLLSRRTDALEVLAR